MNTQGLGKMQRKAQSGLLIIVILGVVAALAAGGTFSTIGSGGMTIDSVSAVNVRVNNGVPSGYFIIDATANRGSESIYGTATTDQFNSALSAAGVKATVSKPFSISITEINETTRYNVFNNNPNANRFKLTYVKNSNSGCTWTIPLTLASLCVTRTYLIVDAPLDSSFSRKSEILITATTGTKTEKLYMSNDQPTIQGSFFAATWEGGLTTGNEVNQAPMYIATYDKERSYWSLVGTTNIAKTNLDTEQGRIQASLDNWAGNVVGNSQATITSAIDTYNNAYNNYKAQDESFNNGFKWTDGRSTSSAAKLDHPETIVTMNPKIRFVVQASDVGISVSVGQPQINGNPASSCFSSGDNQGKIDISVSNTGQGYGSFAASLDGCTKFSQAFSITGVQIAAGQTNTITIPIKTTGSAVGTTETCSVKVCDTSAFGSCVTKPVNLCMTEARFCTEGQTTIDGNCIMKCVNNQKTQDKCCDPTTSKLGTNALTGQYECQGASVVPDGGGNGGTCGWYIPNVLPDILCQLVQWLTGVFATIGILVVIAAIGAVVFFVFIKK